MLKYGWILLFFCGIVARVYADTLSPERHQQFLYYFYEAERLIRLNKTAEAREIVEFCYELNPNDAAINNYMGYYAQEDQDLMAMLGFFKRAFELAESEYWHNYNVLLLQTELKKNEQMAIANLERVAKNNPKDENVHMFLQKAYISLEDLDKALKLQDRLDSIRGYNEESAMQRYRLNMLLGDTRRAIYEIERYLDNDPENYQFQVFLLQLYEQTKQPREKMIEAYEAVLKFDSRNLMLMNNLAWNLCISGGDLKRAEELSRITIMSEPSNPIYLDTYAWIMYHTGDYESALFYIQRAMVYETPETSKEIKMHYEKIKRKQK